MSATEPMKGLPPGRSGLSREFVAKHKRERVLSALCQDLRANGYTGWTITNIVKVAHVSRATFYQVFDSKQACIKAVLDGDVLVEAEIFSREELATVKRFLYGEGS